MNLIIQDDCFRNEAEAANSAWPADDWPGWVTYTENGSKRASDTSSQIPAPCAILLARMAQLPVNDWFPGLPDLVPDLGLHGSGLHEIMGGTGLARHLDSNTHGRLGLARVLSAILWVHPAWEQEWGGELRIGNMGITPAPGRLVVFDCRELWHSVAPVTMGISRRAAAMFWYAAKPGNGTRLRAMFSKD